MSIGAVIVSNSCLSVPSTTNVHSCKHSNTNHETITWHWWVAHSWFTTYSTLPHWRELCYDHIYFHLCRASWKDKRIQMMSLLLLTNFSHVSTKELIVNNMLDIYWPLTCRKLDIGVLHDLVIHHIFLEYCNTITWTHQYQWLHDRTTCNNCKQK